MLRTLKIVLVLSVAAWGLLGAFGNLTDWSGAVNAVSAVTSMATVKGGTESWQATNSQPLIFIGAAFILLLKIVCGILCLIGAKDMWRARAGTAQEFQLAKSYALSGCAVAIILLFVGWIVIAAVWFELWRSPTLGRSALDTAFRYGGFIALIALFVSARDDEPASSVSSPEITVM
jgi:predicted small integral membrane protein